MMLLSRGRILIEGDPKSLPAEHGATSLEDLFIDLARESGEGTMP
jgi:ABC-2 type transport system ATP-binding protein